MKSVSLTELKNNFGKLMALVKNGKTSLLVFERDTPVIKVIYAGDSAAGDDSSLARLERAGYLLRAASRDSFSVSELATLRIRPRNPKADVLGALMKNRDEDR